MIIQNDPREPPLILRPGPQATLGNVTLDLPTVRNGLVIEAIAQDIIVTSGLGFKVQYDGTEEVVVHLTSDELRDNTCGLCGRYNDNPDDDWRKPDGTLTNDPYQFGLSWKGIDDRGRFLRDAILGLMRGLSLITCFMGGRYMGRPFETTRI